MVASDCRVHFDGCAVCVLRWVTDMSGQIRGMGSRICPDIRVANLAGCAGGFGSAVLVSEGWCRIFPAMFGLRSPLGRDEMSCGLNATNVAARSRHPRQDARAWDELH